MRRRSSTTPRFSRLSNNGAGILPDDSAAVDMEIEDSRWWRRLSDDQRASDTFAPPPSRYTHERITVEKITVERSNVAVMNAPDGFVQPSTPFLNRPPPSERPFGRFDDSASSFDMTLRKRPAFRIATKTRSSSRGAFADVAYSDSVASAPSFDSPPPPFKRSTAAFRIKPRTQRRSTGGGGAFANAAFDFQQSTDSTFNLSPSRRERKPFRLRAKSIVGAGFAVAALEDSTPEIPNDESISPNVQNASKISSDVDRTLVLSETVAYEKFQPNLASSTITDCFSSPRTPARRSLSIHDSIKETPPNNKENNFVAEDGINPASPEALRKHARMSEVTKLNIESPKNQSIGTWMRMSQNKMDEKVKLLNQSEIDRAYEEEMKSKRTNPPVRRSSIFIANSEQPSSIINITEHEKSREVDVETQNRPLPIRHSNIPLPIHINYAEIDCSLDDTLIAQDVTLCNNSNNDCIVQTASQKSFAAKDQEAAVLVAELEKSHNKVDFHEEREHLSKLEKSHYVEPNEVTKHMSKLETSSNLVELLEEAEHMSKLEKSHNVEPNELTKHMSKLETSHNFVELHEAEYMSKLEKSHNVEPNEITENISKFENSHDKIDLHEEAEHLSKLEKSHNVEPNEVTKNISKFENSHDKVDLHKEAEHFSKLEKSHNVELNEVTEHVSKLEESYNKVDFHEETEHLSKLEKSHNVEPNDVTKHMSKLETSHNLVELLEEAEHMSKLEKSHNVEFNEVTEQMSKLEKIPNNVELHDKSEHLSKLEMSHDNDELHEETDHMSKIDKSQRLVLSQSCNVSEHVLELDKSHKSTIESNKTQVVSNDSLDDEDNVEVTETSMGLNDSSQNSKMETDDDNTSEDLEAEEEEEYETRAQIEKFMQEYKEKINCDISEDNKNSPENSMRNVTPNNSAAICSGEIESTKILENVHDIQKQMQEVQEPKQVAQEQMQVVQEQMHAHEQMQVVQEQMHAHEQMQVVQEQMQVVQEQMHAHEQMQVVQEQMHAHEQMQIVQKPCETNSEEKQNHKDCIESTNLVTPCEAVTYDHKDCIERVKQFKRLSSSENLAKISCQNINLNTDENIILNTEIEHNNVLHVDQIIIANGTKDHSPQKTLNKTHTFCTINTEALSSPRYILPNQSKANSLRGESIVVDQEAISPFKLPRHSLRPFNDNLLTPLKVASANSSPAVSNENENIIGSTEERAEIEYYFEKLKYLNETRMKQAEEMCEKFLQSHSTDSCLKSVFNPLHKPWNQAVKKRPHKKVDLEMESLLKKPKLYMKEEWVTKKLYGYVQKKLKPQYQLKTRARSEKFIKDMATVVNNVVKLESNFYDYVNDLKNEMARLKIIKTHQDFNCFVIDFLPFHFRIKAIPSLGRNVPKFKGNLFDPIIEDNEDSD